MSTVFQVPGTRIENWNRGGFQVLKVGGYVVTEDHEKLALAFGTEGRGIIPSTDQHLDRRVKVPMMGGADSLNVAAAAAVAFYATR